MRKLYCPQCKAGEDAAYEAEQSGYAEMTSELCDDCAAAGYSREWPHHHSDSPWVAADEPDSEETRRADHLLDLAKDDRL